MRPPKYDYARDFDPRRFQRAIERSRLARAGEADAELLATVPAGMERCPHCGDELVEAGPVTGCLCGFVAVILEPVA